MFRKLRRRWETRNWGAVKILYTNGSEITVKVNKLKLTRLTSDARLSKIEWEGGMLPRPLFIGVDEIIAVYEID